MTNLRRSAIRTAWLLVLFAAGCGQVSSGTDAPEDIVEPAYFGLLSPDPAFQLGTLDSLSRDWRVTWTPALLEYISISTNPILQQRALGVLATHSGHNFGFDINAWYTWMWSQDYDLPDGFAAFKSRLYRRIDPRFADYFSPARGSTIRLDEIRWGGVRQDGIPPLRRPAMVAAADADYLDDANIVFGIEVNGDVRAYPKRILAWHEMFVDTVGGVPVTGVYCTLCGSMILYESTADQSTHELGTSGFLFRSNKLMYDNATQSLWNTMWGTPVVGPLVGQGIRLPRRSVVTTTWGEWRQRHPDTAVLSLDTGHRRDYSEGEAYRAYFATDDLMFNSPLIDERLANKAEVLGLVFNDVDARPLAVSAEYARANPLLHESVGAIELVVLTDRSGAMRVFETGGHRFAAWDGNNRLSDTDGRTWLLGEASLTRDNGETLSRLASHSAFWFGWYGAYSNTRLLH